MLHLDCCDVSETGAGVYTGLHQLVCAGIVQDAPAISYTGWCGPGIVVHRHHGATSADIVHRPDSYTMWLRCDTSVKVKTTRTMLQGCARAVQ
jgi:hypothetical protein